MFRLGLRNQRNSKVTRTGMSNLLNNPFYLGLIRLKHTGEIFSGIHEPLVSKSVFDRVQQVLEGKTNTKVNKHDFLFRRLLKCTKCGYSLIGETQKGHTYYRCHTRGCHPIACIREDIVEEEILQRLARLQFNDEEKKYFQKEITQLKETWESERDTQIDALNLRVGQIQNRLARLTDAYMDRVIEKELFEERKTALLMERMDVQEKQKQLKDNTRSIPDQLAEFLELAGNAYFQYKMGLPEEKRDLLRIVTSNRLVDGKKLDFTLSLPFGEIENRSGNTNGAPYRTIPRTWDRLIQRICDWLKDNSTQVDGESI